MDKVALQAVLPRHSSGVAWEVQAGSCCKEWRMVYGLLNVEWRGRKTGGTKAWRQRTRSVEPGLRPWKRRKVRESKEGKGFHQGEKAVWKKSGGVEMDLEHEAESRKKLDEQKRNLEGAARY